MYLYGYSWLRKELIKMSGVRRVFVEKKKPFAVNAKELHDEIFPDSLTRELIQQNSVLSFSTRMKLR